MKRIVLTVGLSLLLALILATPSFAGGWAVVTLDDLPGKVIAGEQLEIGFMVRQHGIRPLERLEAAVFAQGPGKLLTFPAEEKGQPGHYVATLIFPEAGEWEWSIQAFSGNQPMPALTVVTGATVAGEPVVTSTRASAQWPQWVVGLLGAVAVLAGLIVSIQRKARWAMTLVLAGLVLSAGSIVSAAGQPEVRRESDAALVDSEISQVDLGRRLFIAKGCMVCHSHAETNKIREFGVDTGPNLTDFTASPDYLRLWLKDPLEVKSTAQMPQLELSEVEIDALIAFINDKGE